MKALLGDHEVTRHFKATFPLEFADVQVPQTAFKRVVRDLEFDVAEMALVTFLLAKAHGKPLRLLPVVLTARFQHPYLVSSQDLSVKQLEGKRVGQRSYSVTTATWVRGIMADDHGVDLDSVRWVSFEEPHVAEFRDPPNVVRAPAGAEMIAMLLAGDLDAAIVGEPPKHERLRPMIPDPRAAAEAWNRKHRAIQINHMLTLRDSVSESEASRILEAVRDSRVAAGNPKGSPFGMEDNRRNLEVAIECVYRQKMIPRRFTVEELFH